MAVIRYLTAIAIGLGLFGGLAIVRQWHASIAFGALDSTPPLWLAVMREPLFALSQVLPAFVAGFVARKHGWAVGAAVGFLSWMLGDLVFGQVLLQHATPPGLLRNLFGAALGTAIVGIFSGVAGTAAAARPNSSFKPEPVRGSALFRW